jgi:hypothetical protein
VGLGVVVVPSSDWKVLSNYEEHSKTLRSDAVTSACGTGGYSISIRAGVILNGLLYVQIYGEPSGWTMLHTATRGTV